MDHWPEKITWPVLQQKRAGTWGFIVLISPAATWGQVFPGSTQAGSDFRALSETCPSFKGQASWAGSDTVQPYRPDHADSSCVRKLGEGPPLLGSLTLAQVPILGPRRSTSITTLGLSQPSPSLWTCLMISRLCKTLATRPKLLRCGRIAPWLGGKLRCPWYHPWIDFFFFLLAQTLHGCP